MLFRRTQIVLLLAALALASGSSALRGQRSARRLTEADAQVTRMAMRAFEAAHECKGCTGIGGPCISGHWQKSTVALNNPHRFLFCSGYQQYKGKRFNKCPHHYTDCFPAHPKLDAKYADPDPRSAAALPPAPRHTSTRARRHHGHGRRRRSAAVAGGGGGGGVSGKLAALQQQIKMLKLERQIAALKMQTGGR